LLKTRLEIGRLTVDDGVSDMLALNVRCWAVHVGAATIGHAVHFTLSLGRPVTISGMQKQVMAATWESAEGAVCPDAAECADVAREAVSNLIDGFLTDLAKANPAAAAK
jgi:hypothetical protein